MPSNVALRGTERVRSELAQLNPELNLSGVR